MRTLPLRTWLILGVIVFTVVMSLAWCSARRDAQNARSEARLSEATGKALDKVTAQTETIRQEQQEKQREVDAIEGSRDRLPDGYGESLERVRRNGRDKNS